MKKIHKLLFISLLFQTSNCLAQEWSSEIIQEQIRKGIKQYIGESSKPVEEVKKLSKWEYQVFSVKIEDSPSKMQSALNDIGEKRWECFHTEKIFTKGSNGERVGKLFFFCKRKPDTLLKYIPKSLLGR